MLLRSILRGFHFSTMIPTCTIVLYSSKHTPPKFSDRSMIPLNQSINYIAYGNNDPALSIFKFQQLRFFL